MFALARSTTISLLWHLYEKSGMNRTTIRQYVFRARAFSLSGSPAMKKESTIAKRLMRGSQPARARAASGVRYAKGHKKVGGRKKGTPNRLTTEIREMIIAAFTELGADGRGAEGLKGFIKLIGREDLKSAAMLLRAVLPMQVNASINTSVNVKYKTLQEATEEARKLGLPERRVFELQDFRRIEDARNEPPPAK